MTDAVRSPQQTDAIRLNVGDERQATLNHTHQAKENRRSSPTMNSSGWELKDAPDQSALADLRFQHEGLASGQHTRPAKMATLTLA